MENVSSIIDRLYPISFKFICSRAADPISAFNSLQTACIDETKTHNSAGEIVEIVTVLLNQVIEPKKTGLTVAANGGAGSVEVYYLATAVIKLTKVAENDPVNIDPYQARDIKPGDPFWEEGLST